MRYLPAFSLPLALFFTIIISISILEIFNRQLRDIEILTLFQLPGGDFELQTKLLLMSQLNSDFVPEGVDRHVIPLDGLFNLSHLVDTGAFGSRSIDVHQHEVLIRILAQCNIPDGVGQQLTEFVGSMDPEFYRLGILPILAELGLSVDMQINIMSCVRLAPPLFYLNLLFVDPAFLSEIFDLTPDQANLATNYLRGGQIRTLEQFKDFIAASFDRQVPLSILRHLSISDDFSHASVFWTQDNMTFSYIDQTRSQFRNWEVNWSIILWVPEVFDG